MMGPSLLVARQFLGKKLLLIFVSFVSFASNGVCNSPAYEKVFVGDSPVCALKSLPDQSFVSMNRAGNVQRNSAGTEPATWQAQPFGEGPHAVCFVTTSDLYVVVSSTEGDTAVLDAGSGELVWRIPDHFPNQIISFAISEAQRTLALSADHENTIFLYNLVTKRRTNYSIDTTLIPRILTLGFAQDDTRLYGIGRGYLGIWDTNSGDLLRLTSSPRPSQSANELTIHAATFTNDLQFAALSIEWEGQQAIQFINVASNRQEALFPLIGEAISLAFSLDNLILKAFSGNGYWYTIDLVNQRMLPDPLHAFPWYEGVLLWPSFSVTPLIFSPNLQNFMSPDSDGSVRIWHLGKP